MMERTPWWPPWGSLHHRRDRKSTSLNSSHSQISYAVFCLKKKKYQRIRAKERRQRYVLPLYLQPASDQQDHEMIDSCGRFMHINTVCRKSKSSVVTIHL